MRTPKRMHLSCLKLPNGSPGPKPIEAGKLHRREHPVLVIKLKPLHYGNLVPVPRVHHHDSSLLFRFKSPSTVIPSPPCEWSSASSIAAALDKLRFHNDVLSTHPIMFSIL